jgi:hypothetical protein
LSNATSSPEIQMPGTLTPEDLNSAVEAGVIDAAQAEKLKAMRTTAGTPSPADMNGALSDEERFRFLNGFNDVFLTIGVLLVAGALLSAAAPSFSGSKWLSVVTFAAVVFWSLSEILVRGLRAVLPGIALSVLFVAFAAAAFVIEFHSGIYASTETDLYSELEFWRNPTLLFAAPALTASILYYLRFRFPFALALIAVTGFICVSKGLLALTGVTAPYVGFACGLIILAAALFYDTHDPSRTSRLSDCAFWLHLVAAPLIVSPVIALIKNSTNGSSTSAIVLLTVLALGLFALAIDRRALLVSSLIYFTIAVYDLLSGGMPSAPGSATPSSFVLTLALVGAFVLILGIFWHPLRNRLLPFFQNTAFSSYLPPARP